MKNFKSYVIKDGMYSLTEIRPKKLTYSDSFANTNIKYDYDDEHPYSERIYRPYSSINDALLTATNDLGLTNEVLKKWKYDPTDNPQLTANFYLNIYFDKNNNLIDENSTDIIKKWNSGRIKLYFCDAWLSIVKQTNLDSSDVSGFKLINESMSTSDEEWLRSYGW